MKMETLAVHAGAAADPVTGSVAPPLHLSSTFVHGPATEEIHGYIYIRDKNPTQDRLEAAMSALEGGEDALAFSSGMGATCALFQSLEPQSHVIIPEDVYVHVRDVAAAYFKNWQLEYSTVDTQSLSAITAALRPNTKVLWTETPSNPQMKIMDIAAVARIAHQAGAHLVVDNTFATPLLVRPLELGANMSVQSATKFLSGHGDVMGGVITADAEYINAIRGMSRTFGPLLGPFESYLTMRGIKTFPIRMERQCLNACRVAQWLGSHPRISRVHYLADPKHPDALTIRRLLPEGLYGAIVSFEIKDARKEDVFRFMDKLRLVVSATSLGDVHSLLLYPLIASHRDLSPKQRERMGIHDGFVRLCAGIEAAEDIIADLEQALE